MTGILIFHAWPFVDKIEGHSVSDAVSELFPLRRLVLFFSFLRRVQGPLQATARAGHGNLHSTEGASDLKLQWKLQPTRALCRAHWCNVSEALGWAIHYGQGFDSCTSMVVRRFLLSAAFQGPTAQLLLGLRCWLLGRHPCWLRSWSRLLWIRLRELGALTGGGKLSHGSFVWCCAFPSAAALPGSCGGGHGCTCPSSPYQCRGPGDFVLLHGSSQTCCLKRMVVSMSFSVLLVASTGGQWRLLTAGMVSGRATLLQQAADLIRSALESEIFRSGQDL